MEQSQQLIQEEEKEIDQQVPLCGGNLATVVTNSMEYIDEISYNIGPLKLIENAD